MRHCKLCKRKIESGEYFFDINSFGVDIEVAMCSYCYTALLGEFLKQFVLENSRIWNEMENLIEDKREERERGKHYNTK